MATSADLCVWQTFGWVVSFNPINQRLFLGMLRSRGGQFPSPASDSLNWICDEDSSVYSSYDCALI